MVDLSLTYNITNENSYNKPAPNPTNNPSFNETWSAQLEYNYGSIGNSIDNYFRFGVNQNQEFDPEWGSKAWELLSGEDKYYLPFKANLLSTMNEMHYNHVKTQIDKTIESNKTIADTGFGQNMMGYLLDPINLFTLPIGGPVTSSFFKAGALASARVASPVVGLELINHQLDPTRTQAETALNMSSATLIAFGLGGALGKLRGKNADLIQRIDNEQQALIKDLSELPDNKVDLAFEPNRVFKDFSASKIVKEQETAKEQLLKLNDFLNEQEAFKGKPFKREGSAGLLDDPEFLKIAGANPEQTLGEIIEGAKIKKADLEERIFDFDAELKIKKIEEKYQGKDMWGIADNWFTNSPFFQAVTTPMKRSLQSKQLKGARDFVKKAFIELAGDAALNLRANKWNIASPQSVWQKSAVTQSRWVRTYDRLYGLFGEDQKVTNLKVMDYHIVGKKQFNEWFKEVNRKRIFKEKPSTPTEATAIKELDAFYTKWEQDLLNRGLLRRGKNLTETIRINNVKLQKLEEAFKNNDDLTQTKILKTQLDEQRKIVKQLEEEVRGQGTDIEPFNPRYWDQQKIKENRDEFEKILREHYKENPEVWVYDKVKKDFIPQKLDDSDEAINLRAKKTTDKILGLQDLTDADATYVGKGQTKHLKFRELDIANTKVYDFIQQDPQQIMKVYSQRMSPKVHMVDNFGTADIEQITMNLRSEMKRAGVSISEENARIRDFVALHDRVAGTVLKNPDSWSQQTRRFLTEAAQLSYLGTAGLASLTDFSKIIMEHNLGPTFKVLFNLIDDQKVTLNAKEGRLAGEILEILNADSYLRFSENVINNPFENTMLTRGMAKVRNAFFFVNGLAPLTNIAKKMDSMIRVHETIEMAITVKNKGYDALPKIDREKLARYGLDKKTLVEIASAPHEKTPMRTVAGQKLGGLYLGNTEKWVEEGVSQQTLDKFRASLNSGIQNTIMLGTPADKPIAVDGVFYINKHLGKMFGLKEDKIVRGYARLESGLGALPFQFYSYSFAAMNKVTAGLAMGQQKNFAWSILGAMGLGYMGLKLKNIGRPYVMENMSMEDKIARSFDMSGLAALYSDAGYSAGAFMKDAFDYDALGKFGLNRKGPDGNLGDAITTFTGAGTAWAYNIAQGMKDFYDGNYSEGAKEFLFQSPFNNTLLGRGIVSDIRGMVEKGRF
tara:strand:- start:269 stop:3808 length:3540 start_codon:yes stop_codon:yes gene_type:complete